MDHIKKHLKYVMLVVLSLAVPFVEAAKVKDDARNAKNAKTEKSRSKAQTKPVKVMEAPVAEGFLRWHGFETVLPGSARNLSSSDLRGRFVILVWLKYGDDLQSQFETTMNLQNYGFNANHNAIYDFGRPHDDTMVVFNIIGADESFLDGLKKDARVKNTLRRMSFNFYSGLTFEGVQSDQIDYPYLHVISPEGTAPIFASKAGQDICAKVSKLLKKERALQKKWHDYYGFVDEVKYCKGYDAAIAEGRALAKIEAELRKGIVSSDPEKAKESQMLYDAIEQRKGDLEFFIRKESAASPAAAIDDYGELISRFPDMKKNSELRALVTKANADKDVAVLMKFYPAFRIASDVNRRTISAKEASRLVADIKKARPQLDKLAESKNICVQNVAMSMQQMADELIAKLEEITD